MSLKHVAQVTNCLYRSSQPEDAGDFEYIINNLKVRHVIDLENEFGESPWETEEAQKYGVNVYSLPMHSLLPPGDTLITLTLDIMNRLILNQTPVLVHCKHGEDRTGLIIGTYRHRVQGWAKARAWREMRERGFHPLLLGLTAYFWVST